MCKCKNTLPRNVKSSRKLIFTMVEQPEVTRRFAERTNANAVNKARRRHRRAGRTYGKGMPTTHTKVLSQGAWSWDTSPRASPSTSPCPTGRRASTRRATSTSTTTPMRRSPSATPRAPTPQSTPQLLLKQPTRATAELRFPGRPATLPGPRSCPTPTTVAWTQARPYATTA